MIHPTLHFSRDILEDLCRQHHIRSLSLFGSVVRNDFSPESDVDVFLEFEPAAKVGLFDMVRVQKELETLFGSRRVDVATSSILGNPFRKDRILSEMEQVYAA